jgi:hypothetical protein
LVLTGLRRRSDDDYGETREIAAVRRFLGICSCRRAVRAERFQATGGVTRYSLALFQYRKALVMGFCMLVSFPGSLNADRLCTARLAQATVEGDPRLCQMKSAFRGTWATFCKFNALGMDRTSQGYTVFRQSPAEILTSTARLSLS